MSTFQPPAGSPVQTSPAPPSVLCAGSVDGRLRRFLGGAAFVLTGAYIFLDYWNYSRMWHADPREWADLLAGRGLAPAQYRIGILKLAAWLGHLSHMERCRAARGAALGYAQL